MTHTWALGVSGGKLPPQIFGRIRNCQKTMASQFNPTFQFWFCQARSTRSLRQNGVRWSPTTSQIVCTSLLRRHTELEANALILCKRSSSRKPQLKDSILLVLTKCSSRLWRCRQISSLESEKATGLAGLQRCMALGFQVQRM